MGAEWDGIGRDETGRDRTGRDGTGWDWPATSWEEPEFSASENRRPTQRLSACRNRSRGRGLSGAQGRADRPPVEALEEGRSQSQRQRTGRSVPIDAAALVVSLRSPPARATFQPPAEMSCLEVESTTPRAQPPGRSTEHNSMASVLRWRIFQMYGWKPLPPDEFSARQEYSFITA